MKEGQRKGKKIWGWNLRMKFGDEKRCLRSCLKKKHHTRPQAALTHSAVPLQKCRPGCLVNNSTITDANVKEWKEITAAFWRASVVSLSSSTDVSVLKHVSILYRALKHHDLMSPKHGKHGDISFQGTSQRSEDVRCTCFTFLADPAAEEELSASSKVWLNQKLTRRAATCRECGHWTGVEPSPRQQAGGKSPPRHW